MKENEFLELGLTNGQIVLIHPVSGPAFSGAYIGKYDNKVLEFELDNHASGEIERILLTEIRQIVV